MSDSVSFTLYKSPNLDLAIAEAVLSGLGLTTTALKNEFINSYGYKDLVTFFKQVARSPVNAKAYSKVITMVKKHGKIQVLFVVPSSLAKDIREFLAIRENKFSDRVKDVVKQSNSTVADAAKGVNKNNAEALNDLDKGAGRTAQGLWNSMTRPVGSNEFGQGVQDLKGGVNQFGSGIFKAAVQSPLDAFLTLVGGDFDYKQTILGLESIGRSLNAVEEQILRSVFGNSIMLQAITIKEGYAGIYNAGDNNGLTLTNNQRAITRGNTIYMKNAIPGSSDWNSTLVHETTHVWQNQNGGTDYISEALYAQIFGDGYDYADAVLNKNKSWAMLNPEQQGQLIQDAYDAEFFQNGLWKVPNTNPPQFRPDLAKYMKNVLPQLRAGQGAT